MKYGLFYDTETTGLPLWSEPSDDARQPHLVQVAAKLVRLSDYRVIQAFSCIVKPENWDIPEETVKVHGITHEMASKFGIDENYAFHKLFDMHSKSDFVCGHNVSFDDRIIRIAIKRDELNVNDEIARNWNHEIAETWKQKPRFCTMRESKNILKLPATAKMRGGYKNPKLSEAYSFFTGRNLIGAHDALADVDGCIEVYKGIHNASIPM